MGGNQELENERKKMKKIRVELRIEAFYKDKMGRELLKEVCKNSQD